MLSVWCTQMHASGALILWSQTQNKEIFQNIHLTENQFFSLLQWTALINVLQLLTLKQTSQ